MIFENIPPNEQYTIKFTASILKRLLNLHLGVVNEPWSSGGIDGLSPPRS